LVKSSAGSDWLSEACSKVGALLPSAGIGSEVVTADSFSVAGEGVAPHTGRVSKGGGLAQLTVEASHLASYVGGNVYH
jgi:hypothetical protein